MAQGSRLRAQQSKRCTRFYQYHIITYANLLSMQRFDHHSALPTICSGVRVEGFRKLWQDARTGRHLGAFRGSVFPIVFEFLCIGGWMSDAPNIDVLRYQWFSLSAQLGSLVGIIQYEVLHVVTKGSHSDSCTSTVLRNTKPCILYPRIA